MKVQELATSSLLGLYRLTKATGLLDNRIAESLFLKSYFLYKQLIEDSLAALLLRHKTLIGDGSILDVGANVGYTSCLFAKVVHNPFLVHAFEPDPHNFQSLCEIVRSKGLSSIVKTNQVAVGDKPGSVEFWINKKHRADHRVVTKSMAALVNRGECITVPIVTIDDYVQQEGIFNNISFIKLDVQGYEIQVCRGMQETLKANPGAAILFEYCPEVSIEMGSAPEEVPDFFASLGYLLYKIEKDGSLTLLSKTTESIGAALNSQEGKYFDILALRPEKADLVLKS